MFQVEESVLPVAWRIINDSLRTDVSLLFPPHQIALSCLHMAWVILGKDCKQWFAELHVDFDKIQEISKSILALYELWKSFDEKKEMAGVLSKMPKPKLQPMQQQQQQQGHNQMQQNNWKHLPNIFYSDQSNILLQLDYRTVMSGVQIILMTRLSD